MNRDALLMLIQPRSSHSWRCAVRPSMTYCESVIISRGQKGGVAWMAIITATSSPIWFDCFSPGIQAALFLGSLCANHTPLLHHAFIFPLFILAPSVWISVFGCLRATPGMTRRWPGFLDRFVGSVKIRKHSERLFLLVIDGSKRIALLLLLASRFILFLKLISDRFPCQSLGPSGFIMG